MTLAKDCNASLSGKGFLGSRTSAKPKTDTWMEILKIIGWFCSNLFLECMVLSQNPQPKATETRIECTNLENTPRKQKGT